MRAGAAGVMAVALLAVAACGGGGSGSGSQPAGSIKVTMTEFKYDPSSITVPHGKVVFYIVNAGTASHDVVIVDASSNRVDASELVSPGEATVLTVNDIAAGTYTFYCDQPGHRASGMQGTLIVT